MGKYYKIEIGKLENESKWWYAELYHFETHKKVKSWKYKGDVRAESYSELQFKMADKGFIDKLNKNKNE